jgi:hypothetical protein
VDLDLGLQFDDAGGDLDQAQPQRVELHDAPSGAPRFVQVAKEQDKKLAPLSDDLPLADSGLDSLCVAVIVARLEDITGIDPFAAENAIEFPVTLGDFVRLYGRRRMIRGRCRLRWRPLAPSPAVRSMRFKRTARVSIYDRPTGLVQRHRDCRPRAGGKSTGAGPGAVARRLRRTAGRSPGTSRSSAVSGSVGNGTLSRNSTKCRRHSVHG